MINEVINQQERDFERSEFSDEELYIKLYKLKLPTVIELNTELSQEFIVKLRADNILIFEVKNGKYAFCHLDDEDTIRKLSVRNFILLTPTQETSYDFSFDEQLGEGDWEEIEKDADEDLANLKDSKALDNIQVGRGRRILSSVAKVVPALKYIRKKMNKLEQTGFYKYNDGVIIPFQNSGSWGMSIVEDYIDEETGLNLTVDLSDDALRLDPKVFLIRQLVLKKSGMPYSRHALDLLKKITNESKKELSLNQKTISKILEIDIDVPVVINDKTVNLKDEINDLTRRFNGNLSNLEDRLAVRTYLDPILGTSSTLLWIISNLTQIPQLKLVEAIRTGSEAGFELKNELLKMDPEILKELGGITVAALTAKHLLVDKSSNLAVRFGLGTLIGVGTSAIITIQAERIAKHKIELARQRGDNLSNRDQAEIIEKYKEQAQRLVGFYASINALTAATNSFEVQQMRMNANVSPEEVQNVQLNRGNHLENHLQKDIPVKGNSNLIEENNGNAPKDIPIKGDGNVQDELLTRTNGMGKPPIDGDANLPNGNNAGQQAVEDAKEEAGRRMERILPGSSTTELIDERGAAAWANEWGRPVADRTNLVNAIQDIENYFRTPAAGFDPAGAERAIHEILGHGNTTADITAEDIARIGAILSNARTSGFAGIDINAMLNVNHPDHGIAVAAAQRAIAARPDIFNRAGFVNGFAYPGVLRFIGTPNIGAAAPILGALIPPAGPGIVIGPVDFGAWPGDFLFNTLGLSREQAAFGGIVATGILGLLAIRRRNNQNQQAQQPNQAGGGQAFAYPPINVARGVNQQQPQLYVQNVFPQPFAFTPQQFFALPQPIQQYLRNRANFIVPPINTWRGNRQFRGNLQNWVNNMAQALPYNNNRDQNAAHNQQAIIALVNLRNLLNARRPDPQAINAAIDEVIREYFLAYPPPNVNPVPLQVQVQQQPVIAGQPQQQPLGHIPFHPERIFGMVNNGFNTTPDQFRTLINNFARLTNQQNWDRRRQNNLRELIQALRNNFRNQYYLMGLLTGLEPLINERHPDHVRINQILDDIGNAYQGIYENRAQQAPTPAPNGGAPANQQQQLPRPQDDGLDDLFDDDQVAPAQGANQRQGGVQAQRVNQQIRDQNPYVRPRPLQQPVPRRVGGQQAPNPNLLQNPINQRQDNIVEIINATNQGLINTVQELLRHQQQEAERVRNDNNANNQAMIQAQEERNNQLLIRLDAMTQARDQAQAQIVNEVRSLVTRLEVELTNARQQIESLNSENDKIRAQQVQLIAESANSIAEANERERITTQELRKAEKEKADAELSNAENIRIAQREILKERQRTKDALTEKKVAEEKLAAEIIKKNDQAEIIRRLEVLAQAIQVQTNSTDTNIKELIATVNTLDKELKELLNEAGLQDTKIVEMLVELKKASNTADKKADDLDPQEVEGTRNNFRGKLVAFSALILGAIALMRTRRKQL